MFQTTKQDIKNGKTGDMSSLPFDETRVIGSDHASWSADFQNMLYQIPSNLLV